ncbi:MAG: serine hydrolase [Atopococcus tabaci]|uniref:Serine hydrolase n=1 Tax=Atopococcus tabaci TaxID=269774 RepID=A0AA43UDH0_9LACT|nr:serine hydrolase [Atopococcus tabaci]
MKKLTFVILFMMSFLTPQKEVYALDKQAAVPPDIKAEAAFSIDYDSQQVLVNKDGDSLRPIASMSKMIGAYILLEAIQNGELSWEEEVTASKQAAEISENQDLSNVPLIEGNTYTVRELFDALAIYSANSATIALAEHYAGSETNFIVLMQNQLDSWGISDYYIISSTGLNNALVPEEYWYPGTDEEDENMLSARDTAKVAHHLVSDFPAYLDLAKVPEMTFRPGQEEEVLMRNYNEMLPGLAYERSGVTGLKTGTTKGSGASIALTAQEGGRRIIGIIMNAGDGIENKSQRYEASNQLLDYSFNHFVERSVTLEDFGLPGRIVLLHGQDESVGLELAEAPTMMLPIETDLSNWLSEATYHPHLDWDEDKLSAPAIEGMEYASYHLQPSLGYLDENQTGPDIRVLFSETIKSLPGYQIIWNKTINAISSIWQKITTSLSSV